jgi:hypothetical protein
MSTVPTSPAPVCARPRKPEAAPVEVHGTCRWIQRPAARADSPARKGRLQINGAEYLVLELLCSETALQLGWTLIRPAQGRVDAAAYDVLLWQGEMQCQCPDAEYRAGRPGGCKHARALAAALAALTRPLCEGCADRGFQPTETGELIPCVECANLCA